MKQKMLRYKPKLDDRWRYNRVYFSISNDRTFSEKKNIFRRLKEWPSSLNCLQ